MTVQEIRELIGLVNEFGIAELEVQRAENRVRIRRSVAAASQEILLAQAPTGVVPAPMVTPLPSGTSPALQSPPVPGKSATASQDEDTANLVFVKSPIVGTFYEAGSPDTPPFVKVGDHVTTGQVLCIIESMKLMNEIEAEIAGTIMSKLVENGKPVEYGQPLFGVKPA